MKKNIYSVLMATALLAAGVAMTGCKNDNNNPQEPAKAQTYKMSIQASKGHSGNQTNSPKKVLGLDGTTLNATWAAGEQVTVYNETKSAALDGYLEAQEDGASTQLAGELTGTIDAGDRLTLKYLAPNYTDQQGILAYISANCDYAVAENVEVESISSGTIYTGDEAAFVNQQAIVKFTLKDAADHTTLLSPTALTFNDGTSDIASLTSIPAATYTTNGDGVLFVAVPGFSDKTVTLTATVGSDTYTFEKAGTALTNGKYYALTVEMTRQVLPVGAINGKFSISSTKQVYFSKGNVQYQASTDTWRFAENQYDITGYTGYFSNAEYLGWIDLFGWGTGNNPLNNDNNPSHYSEFVDWGINFPSDNDNYQWRTLSISECAYLLGERENHDILCIKAQILGTNGIILLPDDFQNADNISIQYGSEKPYVSNSYNQQQWEELENQGAVFIPAVGWADNDLYQSPGVCVINEDGAYWSSTPYNASQSVGFGFNNNLIDYGYSGLGGQKSDKQGVRLVCDVE